MRIQPGLSLLAALVVAGPFCIAGCDDTAAGAAEDTQEMSKSIEEGTEDAAANTAEATRDAVAATVLTPEIKSAIVANPLLNDPGNEINVESTDETVTLKGYVKTEEMKNTAGEIAQRILDEKNAIQTLNNELRVR